MKHESIQGYRRELDLENAIATVSFTNGEGSYRREYFISAKYQVLAMRFTSGGRPMKFQCNINRRPFEQYAGGNGTDQVWLSGSLEMVFPITAALCWESTMERAVRWGITWLCGMPQRQ